MSRRWTAKSLAALLLMALAGCEPATSPDQAEQPRLKVQLAELPLSRPEQADREALPDIVTANNAFALDLYRKLRSQPGNFVASPACLTAALQLLRAGARGETAAELDRLFHRSGPLPAPALAAFIQDLNADGEKRAYQIRLANAVWVQQGYPLLDPYRAKIHDVFALDDDRLVDFTGHPDFAARTINAWVADRTGGKITGDMAPEAMTAPTKLALTSALYFRGNWNEGFYRPRTEAEPFHVSGSRSVTVPMMHLTALTSSDAYVDAGPFQVLSLICGEGAFALDILLPRQLEALGSLEASLTPGMLAALWPKLVRHGEIIISLPRFRAASSWALRPALNDLGISKAFDRATADFSGINGKPADLFVTAATHQTFLDVNEEGIEAAAFTGVISADSDGGGDEVPIFRANHPFVYLLRDMYSDSIVFIGRLVDPSQLAPDERPHSRRGR
jgi:serpin B